MKNLKSLYFWFGLFAVCFIAYQQVIDTIRPNYLGTNLTVKYLLGIAPNFFPAIGIPALLVVLIPQMKLHSTWLNENKNITSNVISVTGLVAWEFIQTGSKKLHFDWHDILWTLICAFVFQIIWTMSPNSYKETYDGV